jgi:hypothetical protein
MARKRKGVPRLRLRGWYDKFFEGSLPARQQQFLEAFHFKHSDKAKVDNVILQLFRCYGRQHDERIPVEDVVRALLDDDLDEVRDQTVPIPTPLVLALVLRKGFGRERGEKDTTYVGGKKAPTIEKQELDSIVWLARKYASGEIDPEFRARLLKHKTEDGIRDAAAERVIRKHYPSWTDEQVGRLRGLVRKKEVWGRYRRKSRAKKKSPPPT